MPDELTVTFIGGIPEDVDIASLDVEFLPGSVSDEEDATATARTLGVDGDKATVVIVPTSVTDVTHASQEIGEDDDDEEVGGPSMRVRRVGPPVPTRAARSEPRRRDWRQGYALRISRDESGSLTGRVVRTDQGDACA